MTTFRPPLVDLLTIGQMKAEYRQAKPVERERLKGVEPTFPSDRYILVSHLNSHVERQHRRLPSHFELSDGTVFMLLTQAPPRVIDSMEHEDSHAAMYADMFLYLPWSKEEEFLGSACESEEACRDLWEIYGEAALDVKSQLIKMVKNAWL